MAGLGIDFGTTNSLFVTYDKEEHKFEYYNFDGNRPIPTSSTIWYFGGRIEVGNEARSNISQYADVPGHCFVTSVKSKLHENSGINVFGVTKKPAEIASEILNYLKNQALCIRKNNPELFKQAVFTIPINFTGDARKHLREAAQGAGIDLTTFVHEPFSAVLGYYYAKNSTRQDAVNEIKGMNEKNIMVFDWGGGTLDVTIVNINGDKMEEKGKAELTNRAGDAFNERLVDFVWDKFVNSLGTKYAIEYLDNIKTRKLSVLLRVAEIAKEKLSVEETVNYFDQYVVDKHHIDVDVTREEFERLIQGYIGEAENCILRALREAGLVAENIDKVLLTGGSCYIPCVQRMVRDLFGYKVELVSNPDLVIAQGAAVISEMHLMPYLSKSVGILMSDDSVLTMYDSMPLALWHRTIFEHDFLCVDDRCGFAKILICEQDKNHRTHLIGDVMNVVINQKLKRYGQEIRIHAYIDENIVLHVIGQSIMETDTESRKSVIEEKEYHKLSFGLIWNGDAI